MTEKEIPKTSGRPWPPVVQQMLLMYGDEYASTYLSSDIYSFHEGAVLNMAEMIDLAIGTPEIGTVDFVMLHTVLHCLAQQLRCTDKNVEVRGALAAFPVGRQPDDALTVMVSEFLIETDGKSSGADQETILVAERIDKNNRMPNTSTPQKGYTPAPSRPQSAKSTAGVPSKEATKAAVKDALQKATTAGGTVTEAGSSEADDGSEHEEEESVTKDGTSGSKERSKGKSGGSKAGGGSAEAAVAGQGEIKSKGPEKGASGAQGAQEVSRTASGQRLQALPSSEKLSLVTLSKFNLLQTTVQDLKNRVYGTVPNNEELLEGVRSQTNMKGITDMWATVNVSSRLEAAEAGIAKLSSLMQDIVGHEAAASLLQPAEPGAPAAVGQLGTIPTLPRSGMSSTYATKEELAQFPPCLQHLKEEIDQVSNAFYNAMKEMDHKVDEPVKREMAMPVVNVPPPQTGTPGVPNQVQMGQAPGQTSPAPGQMSPAPGQMSPAPGQMSPAPGQTSPAPGQTSPAPGQMSPAPGQTSPGPGQMSPAQGQTSPAQGQISPAPSGQGPPPSGPTTAAPAGTTTSAPSGPSGPSSGAATGSRPVTPKGPSSGGKGHVSTGGGHAGHNQPDMTVVYALSDRVKSLENRMNQCFQVVFSPNGNILQQLNALQEQMDENMRSQLAAQLGGGGGGTCGGESSGGPSPELLKDLQGLMKLYKTVNNMQNQLQQVHETALQLSQEKEERQQNINSLLEQVELLKALKLDREDMAEALADKADLRMLARKVSHDQFELACDDLSRGLEHALGKLNVQESLWQQALDDIQREIETKLDKVELSPLKEFFQKKMKQLQDNLKQMAALRREAEAAGTKSKLLTNVNCISCDAQAFMQTEAGPSVPPKPLQPTKSMKPYLTYELDSIRKSQATNVPQRNMHDWEKIDKQMTTPRVQKVRSETDKHLCNRYCGGSHTMTTPAQRVARSGHFVKQWGPEVVPLTSGFAAGDDGRIYKVSGTESVAVGPGGAIDAPPCTAKSAKKEKQPSKPSLTPDCRCIEDVLPLKK